MCVSFDLLHFSNELQVSGVPRSNHKELKHTLVNVPHVYSERAADGFFSISECSIVDPCRNIRVNGAASTFCEKPSGRRHLSDLPFTKADSHRLFVASMMIL